MVIFQRIEGNNSGISHTRELLDVKGSGHARLSHLNSSRIIVNGTMCHKEGITMLSMTFQILKAAYSIFGNTIPTHMLLTEKIVRSE